MPDTIAPAATVSTPATPPVDRFRPAGGPAAPLAAARERAHAAAAAAPPPQATRPDPLSAPKTAAQLSAEAGTPPAADQAAKPPQQPQINADEASLKTWARLQKENRELTAKLKDAEPAAAAAKTLTDARALYAAGKKMDAIALLAGAKDATGEMEGLLAEYLKGAETKELTVADLQARLDAKEAAEREADEKQRKEDEEKQAAAAAAEATKGATSFVAHVIDEVGPKGYVLAAKPENRDKAAIETLKGVTVLIEERKIDGKTMSVEQTRALIEEALEEVEVEFMLDAQREATRAQLRDRVSKGALQTPAAAVASDLSQRASAQSLGRHQQPETRQPAPTIDASISRPGVTPPPPRRFYSHAEAQERARQAARAGG